MSGVRVILIEETRENGERGYAHRDVEKKDEIDAEIPRRGKAVVKCMSDADRQRTRRSEMAEQGSCFAKNREVQSPAKFCADGRRSPAAVTRTESMGIEDEVS